MNPFRLPPNTPARLLSLAFLACLGLSACGNKSEADSGADSIPAAAAPAQPAPPAAEPAPAPVSTDDPAISVIEDDGVRIKLHRLLEITPDPAGFAKPKAGKKYYSADISVEYLQAGGKSPAEHLLSAYILDDKGNKHSLPMGSVQTVLFVSEEEARASDAAGKSFNTSNPAAGEKFRGRQYGVVMDAGAKAVKFGMLLGKPVEVTIQ